MIGLGDKRLTYSKLGALGAHVGLAAVTPVDHSALLWPRDSLKRTQDRDSVQINNETKTESYQYKFFCLLLNFMLNMFQ